MLTVPYQVLGVGVPQLRARSEAWRKMLRHLSKQTPDHVSVVGPKYIGKSVFLNALAQHFSDKNEHFAGTVYWDLRHNGVDSDTEFYSKMASLLQPVIESIDPSLTKFLQDPKGASFSRIKLLFETLAAAKKRVLIVLDGLDPVLLNPNIPKNLWDSLRALAELASFCMVTSSRRPLRELCMSHESQTSDFFNIFSMNIFRLGALTAKDIQDFTQPFKERSIEIDPEAITAVQKWTGGVPLLVAAFCLFLWDDIQDNTRLTKDLVYNYAPELSGQEAFKECLAGFFWHDCNEKERVRLAEVIREQPQTAAADETIEALIQRGFVSISESKLTCASEFLRRYALKHLDSVTNLRCLFGTTKDFEDNTAGLLELYLSQIPNLDANLKLHIETMIRLLGQPDEAAKFIRPFADRAYTIVFEQEVPSGELPQTWLDEWRRKNLDRIPDRRLPSPSDRLGRFHLVKNMTNSRYDLEGRQMTNQLQLLLSHLKLVGDYGQHQEHESPQNSFIFAACVAAIELARSLTQVYSRRK